MKEQLYHIPTEDNLEIALWKLSPEKESQNHIFMTHGTFSNRKICDGIASFLCERGFTCWVMEWRNHGSSSKTKNKFNFDTIAKYDVKSVFDFLLDIKSVKRLDCLTHSGGGIVLTMFLINNPSYKSKIKSIIFFGAQAFGAADKLGNRIKLLASKYSTGTLGFIPAKGAGSNQHSESYYTIKQWYNWNLNKNFICEDGLDYRDRMHKINLPILSICAKGDTFIAPRKGCEEYLEAFNNKDNELIFLSKELGNLEDYSHSRILKSQNAKKEVWPIALNWITKQEISEAKN